MPRRRSASAMVEDHLTALIEGMDPVQQRALAMLAADGPGDGTIEHPDAREVLQAAMGWGDCHLHRFAVGGPVFGRGAVELVSAADVAEGETGTLEADVHLDQVLVEVGDRLACTYDFGDGWDHTIKLEAVLPRADETPRVRCTAGRRACPPEDVGGVPGFEVLLDVLADPVAARHDPELADLLEWLENLYGGEGFDPSAFDVQEADAAVRAVLDDAEPAPSLLPPAVAELLERATGPGRRALARLVANAGLEVPGAPLTADDVASLAAVHRRLLDLVGTDGVQLSKAGYLPPALVRELVDVVDPHHHWSSTSDREADYLPVLRFRQTAQRLRLVRTLKGRLVLTPAGREVRGHDEALVAHLAASLPLVQERHQRDAGLLVLLAVAAEEVVDRSGATDGGAVALVPAISALGWSRSDGCALSEADVRRAAQDTLEVLRAVGALPARGAGGADVASGAGRFARAALRG